jgi:hypothetical protein
MKSGRALKFGFPGSWLIGNPTGTLPRPGVLTIGFGIGGG